MRNKLLILIVGLFMIGLLSACAGESVSAGSVPAAATDTPRTIIVSGHGKVILSPDIAYLNIGVHTEGQDVKEALASNTSQAQKVSDALKSRGVDAKDIQTTNFNVYPQQQFGPQGEVKETKYVVDNTVYVTVRDLTKIGEILDAVLASGANNINGITFDVADREKALSDARKAAIADARKQADELSAAAGVQLGSLQSLNIVSMNNPVPLYDAKGGVGVGSSAAVPVSAGQLIITVDANLTYDIK